jgi:hypothetical protein
MGHYLGMLERSLKIENQVTGVSASGVCTVCGARFVSHLNDLAEALEQMRRDFGRHSCEEYRPKKRGSAPVTA